MPRPSEPPAEQPARVGRFSPAVRLVHLATATLTVVCLASAACLYLPPLAELVGRRHLVVTVHEWSGLLIPVPVLLGLGSRAFRGDLRRLNRFGPHDRTWLRSALRRDRRPGVRPAGKFNAGQKLYASWSAGAALVMLGTGLLMWFTDLAPLPWRTGATFVHDWLALAMTVAVVGHVMMAVGDPEARRGMRTGSVAADWARREHPLWRPHGASAARAVRPAPVERPRPTPAEPPRRGRR
ncbi:cytochrome b/b6 domain-containing protein [Streptomyces sp. NBC_00193]|uniref:cytochrome b/b6 domain-containing protein n=1 Tax=Streptomyces sp. NBC_00193 TaxID=2975675 RepID=UPI00225A9509|nr:cytochrome b/b6 domain-containing protein [Streptomyces sp. NBC_00193]MCX5300766.1 cytochrome b/b6 domain-containing protein [Streptomyces sp. NBC_00193]